MTNQRLRGIRNRNLLVLGAIGTASLLIRLLMQYDFDRTALLYVGIPYLVAIALLFIERPVEQGNWKRRYLNLVILSLVVMLGSSIVLFEGFVCVVMFMPIYFFVVLLVFLVEAAKRYLKNKHHGRNYVQLLPLLLVLSAFEGVFPEIGFEREYTIQESRLIHASTGDITRKLMQPIALDKPRHWLLSIFPMPYRIEAESLQPGDVHTISYRYHRWFFTNTHEGVIKLEISEVADNYIRTRFIENTSYLASYMDLQGTEILMDPISDRSTKVTIKISYTRFLDPAWYFGPLQSFAIGKMAGFLLDEVITPEHVGQQPGGIK